MLRIALRRPHAAARTDVLPPTAGRTSAVARAGARLALVLLAVAGLSGCFEYTEVLTLDAQGGGTLALDLAVDQAALQAAAGLAGGAGAGTEGKEAAAKDPFALPTREQLEASLATGAPGVKLTDYRDTSTPQKRSLHAESTFATAADLAKLHQTLAADGSLGADTRISVSYEKSPSGAWSFRRTIGSPQTAQAVAMLPLLLGQGDASGNDSGGAQDGANPATDAARLEQVLGQFVPGVGKLHMRFEVRLPRAIAQSNATRVDGKVASWDFDFARLLAAASAGTLEMTAQLAP